MPLNLADLGPSCLSSLWLACLNCYVYTLDFIKWTFLVEACESSFLLLVNQSLGPAMQLLEAGLCSCKSVTAALGHFWPLLGFRCTSTGLGGSAVQFALPVFLSCFGLHTRPVVALYIIYYNTL